MVLANRGNSDTRYSVNISILHVLYQILIVWEREQDEWKCMLKYDRVQTDSEHKLRIPTYRTANTNYVFLLIYLVRAIRI